MLFVSDESGRDEVTPAVPGTSGKVTVSPGGGFEPLWAPGGREIFYRIGARMMSVPFDPVSGRIGAARALFEVEGLKTDAYRPAYVVLPDGRFIMITDDTFDTGIDAPLNAQTEVTGGKRRRTEDRVMRCAVWIARISALTLGNPTVNRVDRSAIYFSCDE